MVQAFPVHAKKPNANSMKIPLNGKDAAIERREKKGKNTKQFGCAGPNQQIKIGYGYALHGHSGHIYITRFTPLPTGL